MSEDHTQINNDATYAPTGQEETYRKALEAIRHYAHMALTGASVSGDMSMSAVKDILLDDIEIIAEQTLRGELANLERPVRARSEPA